MVVDGRGLLGFSIYILIISTHYFPSYLHYTRPSIPASLIRKYQITLENVGRKKNERRGDELSRRPRINNTDIPFQSAKIFLNERFGGTTISCISKFEKSVITHINQDEEKT
jgi:hypothetical protein